MDNYLAVCRLCNNLKGKPVCLQRRISWGQRRIDNKGGCKAVSICPRRLLFSTPFLRRGLYYSRVIAEADRNIQRAIWRLI